MIFDTDEFFPGQKVRASPILSQHFEPGRDYTVLDTRTSHSGDFPSQLVRLAEITWQTEDGFDPYFQAFHFRLASE